MLERDFEFKSQKTDSKNCLRIFFEKKCPAEFFNVRKTNIRTLNTDLEFFKIQILKSRILHNIHNILYSHNFLDRAFSLGCEERMNFQTTIYGILSKEVEISINLLSSEGGLFFEVVASLRYVIFLTSTLNLWRFVSFRFRLVLSFL